MYTCLYFQYYNMICNLLFLCLISFVTNVTIHYFHYFGHVTILLHFVDRLSCSFHFITHLYCTAHITKCLDYYTLLPHFTYQLYYSEMAHLLYKPSRRTVFFSLLLRIQSSFLLFTLKLNQLAITVLKLKDLNSIIDCGN